MTIDNILTSPALAGMRACKQWLVYILVPSTKRPGKTDKIPLHYATGIPSGVNDPATWTDAETAARSALAWGPNFGVGFCFTEAAGWFFIDLDSCLTDGVWSPLAQQIYASFPGAAVEISSSGKGLHFFGRGTVPPHSSKNEPHHAELYHTDRFVALSGTSLSGDCMTDHSAAINLLVSAYFPPKVGSGIAVPQDGPRVDWAGPDSDEELLRRAMQSRSSASKFGGGGPSFADLWHCETGVLAAAYPDPDRPFNASQADAALAQMLAFWCGCDHERIDRLIRQSGLVREKYDRDDYLHRTIAKACAQQVDVLQDKPKPPRDAGVGVTQLRYGMTPDDPYNTARALIQRRFAHADGARLKAWQDTLYRWESARWLEMANGDVRAEVYDFLDREGESHYRPTQSKVSNLIDALRAAAHLSSDSLPPCWISGDALAPAGELVACANGLLHLRTRSMLAATPRFFNLNAVPFNYEATAAMPAQWLQFLRDVWPDDPEAIATLQEVFGYLLTPDTSQQKIFLVIGPKRSGKGTIARVLTEMLGVANVAGPSLASLAKEFGLQPLIGKQAAIIADARLGGHVDAKQVAENLLRISGEDRVDVARKNTSSLSLRLGVRFVLLTNELPRIADASGAMASRFVILTMTESFLGREDPGLTSKLLSELPGVLAWAVEGWHRLNARGYFIEPKSSAGTAQELADLGSPIAAFVRDSCDCSQYAEAETGALFDAWRMWCASQGMQHSGTLQTFGRDLRAAFPSITISQARSEGGRIRLYRGIGVRGTRCLGGQTIASYAPGMPA